MELLNYPTEFGRNRGDFPDLPIVNLFAESADTEGRVVLQSRPGLQESYSLTSDAVRFIYSEPGVFSESLFTVTGNKMYKDTNLLGTIVGDGSVSMDSFEGSTFLSAGDTLYHYNGATLNALTFPDNAATLKVIVGASRLIVIRKETQTIYWSEPLTPSIDALDFAQAENSPDRLLDMLFLGDTLLLFGEATVEFWPTQTSADLPFAPLVGRVYSKGIKNTGAATKLGSGFAWVTDSNQLCLNSPDNVVSTREIEEEIEDAGEVSLWTFFLDSIEFLAIRVGNRTHVYNTLTKTFTEFTTYGLTNWEANCYSNGYFGSADTGRILTWSNDYVDDGDELERRFRVWAPLNMEAVVVNNLFLRGNTGRTPYLAGQYSDPNVEIRTSKDGGNVWSSWRQAQMGPSGTYRKQIRWFGLGVFSFPGALAEFRITDPTPFRVSSVTVNDPYGGY